MTSTPRNTASGVFVMLVAIAALLVVPQATWAANDGVVPQHEQPKKDLHRPEAGIEEKIGSVVPMDLVLRDENDQAITLGDAIGGKPTILVPVYYRCPMLCTKVLNGVLEACRKMPQSYSIGAQFNVVTVSMDPKEHGGLAKAKKDAYVAEYGRPGAENGWRFLTGGTKETIAALLDSVGYRFEFDKMLKEYNHPSALIILSPQGKVTRYFYGIGYDGEFELAGPGSTDAQGKITRPTTTLRLSLVEAGEGKGGSLLDKLTLLCYRYDALHQGYSLQVIWAVRIGGIITLAAVFGGLLFAFRREWRKRTLIAGATPIEPPLPRVEGAGGTA
jgi:protein SCO1/2